MLMLDTKDYQHPIANKELRKALKQLEKEGALTLNDGVMQAGLDVWKAFTNCAGIGEQRWYFKIAIDGLTDRTFGPYEDARAMLLARDRWFSQLRQVLVAAIEAEPRPHHYPTGGTS